MTSRSHRVRFELPQADEQAALDMEATLEVEGASTPERTDVLISAQGNRLVVDVGADDARSLRAATNSILRLAAIAFDMASVSGRSAAKAPQS